MSAPPLRLGPIEWLMLVTLSVLWGGSFFFNAVALEALAPLHLVLLRVGIAALVLWTIIAVRRVPLPRGSRAWAGFLAMGLLNNALPFSLIVWGQTQISSSLASILNATTPFFAVLLTHALTVDERISRAKLTGVPIGLAGVVLLIGPDALAGAAADVLGQLAILGAAISYALAGIFGRRMGGTVPLVNAAGMLTGATILMLPLALAQPLAAPGLPGLAATGAILGSAVFSTALAYLLYFRILRVAGATNVLLVTFLVPVSAVLLGVGLLGESLGWRTLAGMATIFAGLAIIDGRLLRLRRR
ncbi:MAG: DMT family transporter [Azospirillaceae bacterium]